VNEVAHPTSISTSVLRDSTGLDLSLSVMLLQSPRQKSWRSAQNADASHTIW